MTNIIIAYHSGYGHTAKVAEAVSEGVKETGALSTLLKVDTIKEEDWEKLDKADAIILVHLLIWEEFLDNLKLLLTQLQKNGELSFGKIKSPLVLPIQPLILETSFPLFNRFFIFLCNME